MKYLKVVITIKDGNIEVEKCPNNVIVEIFNVDKGYLNITAPLGVTNLEDIEYEEE